MAIELAGSGYAIRVLAGSDGIDAINDNVDVEVCFQDGARYAATFFTLENLRHLFENYRRTGECRSGLYLWASNMIVVERLTLETITETVGHLLTEKELEMAFAPVAEQ